MIPDSSNVFGIISTALSPAAIANKFALQGWSAWKAGEQEWEIRNDHSEMMIEASNENEILIHGPVDPDYFVLLTDKMKGMEFSFSIELYNELHELVTILTNS